MVVEIGIKLDKSLDYYHEMLINNGAKNVFNVGTHDIYWSDKNFDGMSENEIKRSCIRFRYHNQVNKDKKINFFDKGKFQNYKVFDENSDNSFECYVRKLKNYEKLFESRGFKKVFDTKKNDYQYVIGDMKSRIQLQDIDGIGLLLYYDNPDYYHMEEEEQRLALIEEINSYGFDISKDTLGLDKLRTLYLGKEVFSKNQNG